MFNILYLLYNNNKYNNNEKINKKNKFKIVNFFIYLHIELFRSIT